MGAKFAIRLSVEEAEKVRAALRGVGKEGEAALDALGNASARAAGKTRGFKQEAVEMTPALRAVNAVAKDTRQSFDSWAERVPVIGSGLRAIGPAGLAAGVGIAATAAALGELWRQGREAMGEMDQLSAFAADTGLGVETFQALRLEAQKTRVEGEQLGSMLKKFEAGASAATVGTGKFKSGLEATHPELVKNVAAATSMEERLDLVSAALRETTDRSEQIVIAQAAFGKQGAAMIRILSELGPSIDAVTKAYREQGLIIDDKLVATTAELDDQYDMLARRIDVDVKVALAGLAPVILATTGALADASRMAGTFFDNFKAPEDRSFISLQQNIADVRKEIEETYTMIERRENGGFWGGVLNGLTAGAYSGGSTAALRDRVDTLRAQQFELEFQASRRAQDSAAPTSDGVVIDTDALEEVDAIERRNLSTKERLAEAYDRINALVKDYGLSEKAANAERKRVTDEILGTNNALKENEALEKAAAQVRADLGDNTGLLALKEADLNKLVKAGKLSRDEATRSLRDYGRELTGAADATKKWTDFLNAPTSNTERIAKDIDALRASFIAGEVEATLFADSLKKLEGQWREAMEQEWGELPQIKEIERLRKVVEEADNAALAPAERLAKEQQRINQYIGEGGLSADEASRYIKAYAKELTDATDKSYAMRLETALLEGTLNGSISSWEDLRRVALSVMADMVLEWYRTQQAMKGSSGESGWVAAAGSFLGGLFGDGSGASATATTPVAVHHDGYTGAGPFGRTQIVPMSALRGAPTLHTGLAPDEYYAKLQTGEPVLSRRDSSSIARAIERATDRGEGDIEVNIINQAGAQVEARQTRRSGDGKRQLQILIKQGVQDAIGSGGADGVLSKRFGLSPSMTPRG